VAETPSGAARLLATALTSPFIIAAALLAREVSMWMGAAIRVEADDSARRDGEGDEEHHGEHRDGARIAAAHIHPIPADRRR
jgi:hypothetical protein